MRPMCWSRIEFEFGAHWAVCLPPTCCMFFPILLLFISTFIAADHLVRCVTRMVTSLWCSSSVKCSLCGPIGFCVRAPYCCLLLPKQFGHTMACIAHRNEHCRFSVRFLSDHSSPITHKSLIKSEILFLHRHDAYTASGTHTHGTAGNEEFARYFAPVSLDLFSSIFLR